MTFLSNSESRSRRLRIRYLSYSHRRYTIVLHQGGGRSIRLMQIYRDCIWKSARLDQTVSPSLSSRCAFSRLEGSQLTIQASLGVSRDELHRVLAAVADDRIQPTAFWAGYDTARLVSQSFWSEWQCSARQIKIGEHGRFSPEGEGEVRCTPRIWIDIWGRRLNEKWEEAVGCAKGWLISRPGMSEVCLSYFVAIVADE